MDSSSHYGDTDVETLKANEPVLPRGRQNLPEELHDERVRSVETTRRERPKWNVKPTKEVQRLQTGLIVSGIELHVTLMCTIYFC